MIGFYCSTQVVALIYSQFKKNIVMKKLIIVKVVVLVVLIVCLSSCSRNTCPSHDKTWFYHHR